MFNRVSIFLIFLPFIVIVCNSEKRCGSEYGCWSIPPGCAENECTVLIRWFVDDTILHLEMDASLNDVTQTNMGAYVAVGFSDDQRMDDNMVIECVYNGREEVRPYVSYNDGNHNAQLHAASELLILDANFSLIDNKIFCGIDLDFDQRGALSIIDQAKVDDVISKPIYLQFALGLADPYTFAKKKHSLWDGPLYPWTSSKQIHLRAITPYGYETIDEATQSVTFISRNLTYVLVTLHSVMMLWAWWFLASNAILLARYCKFAWPSTKLCGAAVWFQFHRSLMVLSVVLQVIAFLFVIIQAGFKFYLWCTMECTMEHFSKPTHTWTGLIAFTLAVFQPFFAWIRPSGISKFRYAFSCLHWFIGMTAFVVASVAIISAIPLSKTALAQHHAKLPNFWMGLYLIFFTITTIIMEMLVARNVSKRTRRESDNAALIYSKIPIVERQSRTPRAVCNRRLRVFVLLLHTMGSFAICSILSKMLIDSYFSSH